MASEATVAATKTKTERMRGSERATQVFPAVGRPPQLRDSLEEVSPSPFGLPSKPRARPFSLSHSTCARLRARETQGSPYSSKRTSARACSRGMTKGEANHFENGRRNSLADRHRNMISMSFEINFLSWLCVGVIKLALQQASRLTYFLSSGVTRGVNLGSVCVYID